MRSNWRSLRGDVRRDRTARSKHDLASGPGQPVRLEFDVGLYLYREAVTSPLERPLATTASGLSSLCDEQIAS
jgi:hypothetical protein